MAWRARANRVPGRRQQTSPSTPDTLLLQQLSEKAGHSPSRAGPRPEFACGSRIAPTAIMEGTARHGTRQGKVAPLPLASSTLTRTAPKGGSYRGDAGGLPVRLTRNRQLLA
ncbi:hypothetical protein GCM10009742_74820 [Kribbella karoonensis]|uniref:Uncharacterized protein n=1 Tax=Kribbella karoonensis TaxID=324851 RepID=A0ABN2EPR3_9ACTN